MAKLPNNPATPAKAPAKAKPKPLVASSTGTTAGPVGVIAPNDPTDVGGTSGDVTVPVATAKITQARALVTQILAMIQILLRGTLTAKESRALLKARLAGQNLVPLLVGLLQKKPNLAPNGNTATSIQAKYQILQEFLVFAQELGGVAQEVEDTLRQMQAEMYKLSLDIYAIAERSGSDSQVQGVVTQVKTAMKLGPRNPTKQVTTLEAPVLVSMPAAAVSAAQAAAEATGAGTVTVAATAGKKKTGVGGKQSGTTAAAPAGPAAAGGTAAGGQAPAVPQVPVYTPGGPAGTAPATNVPPAGGTGTGH